MLIVDFIQDHGHAGGLNNLNWFGKETGQGEAKDTRARVARLPAGCVLAHDFRGLGPQRRFFGLEVQEDIGEVPVLSTDLHSRHLYSDLLINGGAVEAPHFRDRGDFVHPDTGEVGLPVGGAWRRRGQVRFAVGRARRSWGRKIQPLRIRTRGEKREYDEQPLM